jgi:hypothetical protein
MFASTYSKVKQESGNALDQGMPFSAAMTGTATNGKKKHSTSSMKSQQTDMPMLVMPNEVT